MPIRLHVVLFSLNVFLVFFQGHLLEFDVFFLDKTRVETSRLESNPCVWLRKVQGSSGAAPSLLSVFAR